MKPLPTKTAPSHQWMLEGIKQHQSFQRAFQAAKEHALNAGIFFISASQSHDHGDWQNFCGAYSTQISERSIRRYMEFATEVIEWVKAENPNLVGEAKLKDAALKMVLQSPKGFIALCRELKVMRKFGEYDEVRYRTKKLLGGSGEQIEFEYASAAKAIAQLSLIDLPNFHLKFPEGADEDAEIAKLETGLETALAKVREFRAQKATINA